MTLPIPHAASAHELERMRQYIEEQRAHLLRAYGADSLAEAIVSVKQRCRQMAA